jgi:hypothetical protein
LRAKGLNQIYLGISFKDAFLASND